jgi:hypothetical protein
MDAVFYLLQTGCQWRMLPRDPSPMCDPSRVLPERAVGAACGALAVSALRSDAAMGSSASAATTAALSPSMPRTSSPAGVMRSRNAAAVVKIAPDGVTAGASEIYPFTA